MSTVTEVRAAEKRVQAILDALKKAGARDPKDLHAQLREATDEYARAVPYLDSRFDQDGELVQEFQRDEKTRKPRIGMKIVKV
jgi:hypothetical protein